jgi:hypothetical protein
MGQTSEETVPSLCVIWEGRKVIQASMHQDENGVTYHVLYSCAKRGGDASTTAHGV